MSANRYTYRQRLINKMRIYREHRRVRKVNSITHYNSPTMSYPDRSHMRNLSIKNHIWKHGDRYYKLAHKHYGDQNLWCLIAWFNKAPTESHLKNGQNISIPFPLELALSYMREEGDY